MYAAYFTILVTLLLDPDFIYTYDTGDIILFHLLMNLAIVLLSLTILMINYKSIKDWMLYLVMILINVFILTPLVVIITMVLLK
ncbi:hypothetical protein ACFDHU_06500 [Staphylococcus hyicus]|uniref:hypothetical protein n=1 Tax=Staphylococcus hyicus TaxID=1284 RepID=UPI00057F6CA6|nr:hypothetical protein SHYC_05225 [Staphylococcus hyicus]SQE47300.1 Uncharacterised protein [Staphylococcus hyicus]